MPVVRVSVRGYVPIGVCDPRIWQCLRLYADQYCDRIALCRDTCQADDDVIMGTTPSGPSPCTPSCGPSATAFMVRMRTMNAVNHVHSTRTYCTPITILNNVMPQACDGCRCPCQADPDVSMSSMSGTVPSPVPHSGAHSGFTAPLVHTQV